MLTETIFWRPLWVLNGPKNLQMQKRLLGPPGWTQKCTDFLGFYRSLLCSRPAILHEVRGEKGAPARHLPGRAREDPWALAGKARRPESHLPSCRAPGSSSTLQGTGT